MARVVYSSANPPPKGPLDFTGTVSRTKQSFRKEADINVIMARYYKTGMLVDPSVVSKREAIFGDFSKVGDFQSAQEKVIDGQYAFDSLSAKVRAKFKTPGGLLDFMSDPANETEARELGILPKKAVVQSLGAAAAKPSEGEAPPIAPQVAPGDPDSGSGT